MAIAVFPSLVDAEIVELELLPLEGVPRLVRLLVDSGFTGTSSLVLANEFTSFIRADLPEIETSGALHGLQRRGWISCRVVGHESHRTVIAILTDVSGLSLPERVAGMVGLTYLRQFRRWGAECTESVWRFHLEDSPRP